MQGHTPGPWGIAQDDPTRVNAPTLCRYGGKHAAVADCDFPADAEENEANARLIAAAPDMLAALREAAQFIHDQDGGDPTNITGWASDEHREAWLKTQAAIAKAEGR